MIVSEKGFHSFIFEAVKSSDAGTYECVAVNRAGEASFAVKVEVIGKTEGTTWPHMENLSNLMVSFMCLEHKPIKKQS